LGVSKGTGLSDSDSREIIAAFLKRNTGLSHVAIGEDGRLMEGRSKRALHGAGLIRSGHEEALGMRASGRGAERSCAPSQIAAVRECRLLWRRARR
jgi:hypothetical protein